jgi:hypothetical protein
MGCILLRGVQVNGVNNICFTCTRNCAQLRVQVKHILFTLFIILNLSYTKTIKTLGLVCGVRQPLRGRVREQPIVTVLWVPSKCVLPANTSGTEQSAALPWLANDNGSLGAE